MPHVRRSMLDHDRRDRRATCSATLVDEPRARRADDGSSPARSDGMPDTSARRSTRTIVSRRRRRRTELRLDARQRRRRAVLRLVPPDPGVARRPPRAPARSPPGSRPRSTEPTRLRRAEAAAGRPAGAVHAGAGRPGSARSPPSPCSPTSAARCSSQNGDAVTEHLRPVRRGARRRARRRPGRRARVAGGDRARRPVGRRRLILVALVGACAANARHRARADASRSSPARSCSPGRS